ncbi:MAG: carbohydrate porin [Elusimicrobiota bacterium]|jgi:hypothetical protein|nr:carbohydrate porin [Elusimicrobiota bacterium]
MNKLVSAVLAAVLMLAGANTVFAQKTVDELLNGVQITPSAMIRYQSGNPVIMENENGDPENVGQRGALNAMVNIDFTKEFEGGAVVFLGFEYGANTQEGGSNEGVPISAWSDLGGYAAQPMESIAEFHVTQPLFDDKVSVTFGKFFVRAFLSENEVSEDFESIIFNEDKLYIGILNADLDTLYGGAVKVSPLEYIDNSYQYQVNDIDKFGWDYNAVELTFKLPVKGNEGNYRIGYWQNNAAGLKKIEKVNDDKDGLEYGDRVSASGLAIDIDQKIIEGITFFGKYSMPITEAGSDDYYEYEYNNQYAIFGLGFIVNGAFWSRADDSLGIGFGQVSLTGKAADLKIIDSKSNEENNYKPETHFEFYYNFKVSDALSLIPSIEYIGNPEGGSLIDPKATDPNKDSYIDSVFVFSIRAAISF